MTQHDVLLIHPPAIYDFRDRVAFPGPISQTLIESTEQFITIPIGMLSIADYLDRNGYRTYVDNIGSRMVISEQFDVIRHLKKLQSKVYAIDLHWIVHCQGAMELARLCKSLHPNALVVLGGLTATCFHTEILQEFRFVDAVVRGEAEKPMLQLIKNLESGKPLNETPSVTCRNENGGINMAPLMKPTENLDDFEFARLDLVEPKGPIPTIQLTIPVCRGCIYNCVSCGGSAYTYRTYLGMQRPSFRSPAKIIQDMQKLADQRIPFVHLAQDPRMGGNKYTRELMTGLSREKIDIVRLGIDLFSPPDEEFVVELSNTTRPTIVQISPESGSYHVRRSHGHNWTNEEYMRTAKLCHKHGVPITFFFMAGLAEETLETIGETWRMWDELCLLDHKARLRGAFRDIEQHSPVAGPIFGQMILLDPGSLAFDFPAKYGYHLIFRNLEGYISGISMPSWHQWISYETKQLDRNALANLILESIAKPIYLREKFAVYGRTEAAMQHFRVAAERIVVEEVDRIYTLDESERLSRLKSLRSALDEWSSCVSPSSSNDPYGYRERMKGAAHLSIGLVGGGRTDFFVENIFQLMHSHREQRLFREHRS